MLDFDTRRDKKWHMKQKQLHTVRKYESLKSVETGSRSKYTKEGYVSIICNFLDRQGLIIFIPEDEMIKTTAKLDNIMEYKILKKENYTRIMEALGKAHE